MKKTFLCLALAFANLVGFSQTEVKSKIDKVTVYPYSALVEKSIVVNLQKGENKFVIKNNSSRIKNDNVNFVSSNNWFISSVDTEQSFVPENEALKRKMPADAFAQYQTLKTKKDNLQTKISDCQTLLSVLGKQKTALDNMKAIKNTIAFDTIDNLKAQFEYQRTESQKIAKMISDATKEKENYTYQMNETQNEIDKLLRKHLGGKFVQTNTKDIFVSIYSNKVATNEKINFSYLVDAVTCIYSYDVMLDENINKAVFSLKNSVRQCTGENWQDCEIVFSTSEGGEAGFDAELPINYLNFNETKARYSNNKRMANLMVAKMANSTEEEYVSNDLVIAEEAQPVFMAGVTIENLNLSKEYTLNTKQIIASNENTLTIPLVKDTTAIVFSRYATPKNEEKVYYTALLPDWEDLGLLDVDCKVYLNNKYVSQSYINTANTSDTMKFSVGEDKNVKVARKIRKSSPDKAGFLAKEVEETVTITLNVKNTKSEKINISLKDQVPISNNTEIKVFDIKYTEGDFNANTGLIRWNLNLEPKEEKIITFSYSVKYPKGHSLHLN